MKILPLALAGAALVAAGPAAAVTFTFGGTPTITTANTYNYTAGSVAAQVRGYSWTDAVMTPAQFTSFATNNSLSNVLGALSLTNLSRDAFGFGVCPSGDPAGECNQIETNNRNEIIYVSLGSTAPGVTGFRLVKGVFSQVDSDDTLGLFGVDASGTVRRIGFTGLFNGPGSSTGFGTGEGATGSTTGNGTTYTVNFSTNEYQGFIFANNNAANDGYRLNAITAAVPEPASWGLMMLGFGLVGAALRSRGRAIAAA